MSVRTAVPADVRAIEEAYVRSWRAADAGSLPAATRDEQAEQRRHRHDWAGAIADPDVTVQVGIDGDGRVCGVVEAVLTLPPPRDLPEIVMLYVEPDAWGVGLAPALLAAGERWIADRAPGAARLRVVEDHHRARRFYEREGWVLDPDMPSERTDLATLVGYRRVLGQPTSTGNDAS